MSPLTVTLTMANGPLVGKEYEFCDSAIYLLGRGPECYPRLPDELLYKDISRHHCLLSIHLPELRLLDLGSTNGTFVNGAKVGPGAELAPAPEDNAQVTTVAADADPPGWHPLKDGDVITLGCGTVLIVRIEVGEEGKPRASGRQRQDCAGVHLPGGQRHDHLALAHQG
jgi:pSer/pThr/pTyr-binding forkhead associated (FHA) protein